MHRRATFSFAALLAFALVGGAATARGSEPAVTALPQRFVVGAPRGFATSAGVDPGRSRHAEALPPSAAARVLWQRQLTGGISCNVLVDEQGRSFAAGQSRISQLGADGAVQFSNPGASAGALAAALLTDGTRALLARDGHVMGWSAQGELAFDVALDTPPASGTGTLLPLPDGGVLASMGNTWFEVDATRAARRHASLPAPLQHTLWLDGRALAVDERGRVFEWDRQDAPRALAVGSAQYSAVAAASGALLGIAGRTLERIDRASGELHELARFDAPVLAPLLMLGAPEQWLGIKTDGVWLGVADAAPARGSAPRSGDVLTRLDALADASGAVAWWAADVPLHLEAAPGVGRELPAIRCAAPVSLVPAGRERLVAACNSGAIWLVGPDAVPAAVHGP